MMLDGYHMLIPGPITLDERVLKELARPVIPHYGPEWTSFYLETIELLKQVFDTEGKMFAIPGSGSAALEAAISSSLAVNGRLLVLSNGFFGERVAEIARSRRPDTVVERLPVDTPITKAVLVEALGKNEGVTAVAVVHSESSSGLLNPIESLGQVCQERGVLFIVDAISSIAGVRLSMKRMGIDVCVGASQKCLEGPPGLGLVAVSESAWERIRGIEPRGWYLSLQNWDRYSEMWSDWHPYPITMAVPAFRGLRVGTERVLEEGMRCRWQRHLDMAAWVAGEANPLGFKPVFPPEDASPTVLALTPPNDLEASEVVTRLKTEHRILVAGGMGEYKGKAFRIGNMGSQATKEMMKPLIEALGEMTNRRRDEQHA